MRCLWTILYWRWNNGISGMGLFSMSMDEAGEKESSIKAVWGEDSMRVVFCCVDCGYNIGVELNEALEHVRKGHRVIIRVEVG